MSQPNGGVGEIAWAFTRLGMTSFGGPVAHLGYFREEFVNRRRWLDEAQYADLVALAQFLPGPSSSQVGFALGLMRGGVLGGVAAWVGFTLPSAVLMLLAAYGVAWAVSGAGAGAVHGLLLVAVAVVAQAVWGMGVSLCPDRVRRTMAAAAAALVLLMPSGLTPVGVIAAGAAAGLVLFRNRPGEGVGAGLPIWVKRRWAVMALGLFAALLVGLPLVAIASGSQVVAIAGAFYRAGSLVFGGGHVVLPLLDQSFVATGWLPGDRFLAGYGVAQAVPGPLFTFAAFVGAAEAVRPNGVLGGVVGLLAIFLPGLLLMFGVLPFWDGVRRRAWARAALPGVNAAVVGLLAAALFDPIWTSSVHTARDFAVVLGAFAALVWWRVPAWAVVAIVGSIGASGA